MKMETGYEMDSVSELPPIPGEFEATEDSGNCPFISSINPLEALVPFPHSDFSPTALSFSDLDLLHLQPGLLDSPLSLLSRHLAESDPLNDLFHGGGGFPDAATSSFLLMPNLHSVEQATPLSCLPQASAGTHAEKRFRFTVDVPTPTLDSFVKSGFAISPSPTSGSPAASSSSSSQATTVRDRRRRIAEKTRSLEKLMPWEKKMDMATLLEEAHKYIKFLQAQIAVLRWMPLESVFSDEFSAVVVVGGGNGGDADLLRVLNRQQILQVMANSSGVQTSLYARGCCVFSREQLLSRKLTAQAARNL